MTYTDTIRTLRSLIFELETILDKCEFLISIEYRDIEYLLHILELIYYYLKKNRYSTNLLKSEDYVWPTSS